MMLVGQSKIQQGFLKDGYELISEALNLLNNVYGAMHPEIAQCLRMLARLNYIMGDHVEAMACQQKAVLMSERVNGLEHPYTITEYTHLALYCFANTQVQLLPTLWRDTIYCASRMYFVSKSNPDTHSDYQKLFTVFVYSTLICDLMMSSA
jgi:protein TIF31